MIRGPLKYDRRAALRRFEQRTTAEARAMDATRVSPARSGVSPEDPHRARIRADILRAKKLATKKTT